MPNSFDLFNRVRVANPSANVDYYYGTYNSVADACLGVPSNVRMLGKTVGIMVNGSVVEYWWKSGLSDADLVEKTSGGGGVTYTFGAGLQNVSDTVSVLVDPSTGTNSHGVKLLTVSANGVKYNGSDLTAEQLETLAWAYGKREDEAQENADGLFEVATVVTAGVGGMVGDSGVMYEADAYEEVTMIVTVTVTFDGTAVVPTNESEVLASGWLAVVGETGTYTKSITTDNGVVEAQDFEYVVPSSHPDYGGLEVAKSSETKTVTAVYPIYHGFAVTNDYSDLAEVMAVVGDNALTRGVSDYEFGGAVVNGLTDGAWEQGTLPENKTAWYWILTRNSATMCDAWVGSMIALKTSGAEFVSPVNSSITMSGYKLYVSDKNALQGLPLSSNVLGIINI